MDEGVYPGCIRGPPYKKMDGDARRIVGKASYQDPQCLVGVTISDFLLEIWVDNCNRLPASLSF